MCSRRLAQQSLWRPKAPRAHLSNKLTGKSKKLFVRTDWLLGMHRPQPFHSLAANTFDSISYDSNRAVIYQRVFRLEFPDFRFFFPLFFLLFVFPVFPFFSRLHEECHVIENAPDFLLSVVFPDLENISCFSSAFLFFSSRKGGK